MLDKKVYLLIIHGDSYSKPMPRPEDISQSLIENESRPGGILGSYLDVDVVDITHSS